MRALEGLNEQQQEAVLHTEGPLLILAGAGSGKTRVLTNRIAYLIQEKQVNPWNILAITFTNKAAEEMRSRVNRLVEFGADSIWVSTFHSICARILRRHIDCLGYDTRFVIYDSDDQKNVVKAVCVNCGIDTKIYKERDLMRAISHAKEELLSPEQYIREYAELPESRVVGRVYEGYQQELKKNNAVDFDDLLVLTVRLFREMPEILHSYQERFRYIHVDEYQDTNTVQLELVRLLAGRYRNLCVVGDDDQSIYRFRGANIWNILHFEEYFPDARVIKLEQNYRSTQNILDAANEVISHNLGRKKKHLWTENGTGALVGVGEFFSGYEEADFIARDILRRSRSGEFRYEDTAVLYRTNAQSRLLEEKMMMNNIPYRIIGGINFYSRREIKDLLAYLKTIDSGMDELSVRRIINVPRRGIGDTTIARTADYAQTCGCTFFQALERAREIPGMGRNAGKLGKFVLLIRTLRAKAEALTLPELIKEILNQTQYSVMLEAEGTEEAQERMENIDELISKAASYTQSAENPTLSEFLAEVALVADIDSLEDERQSVALMTLHSAKGLEFPLVYIAGMEEGIFPSYLSISAEDSKEALEEERRLCYVGITRAKKKLILTSARSRMIRGQVQYNALSRFVKEIPGDLLCGAEEDDWGGSRRAAPGRGSVCQVPAGTADRRSVSRLEPLIRKGADIPAKTSLSYGEGDTVQHTKFGRGTVISIADRGRDYEVTVDFEQYGIKKLFAGFAKLQKC